jgi:TadE-like protein
MKLRHGRTRGQSLAEFAVVLPIFLLVVCGLFDLGRAVFVYTSLTNAAREGARLAIVNQDATLIRQRAFGQSAAVNTTDPATVFNVGYYKPFDPNDNKNDDAVDPSNNEACAPIRIGCVAVVEFDAKFDLLTPVVRQIAFKNGVQLKTVVSEPVEYVCSGATCLRQP